MKKLSTFILSSLIAAFVLCSCGKDDPKDGIRPRLSCIPSKNNRCN